MPSESEQSVDRSPAAKDEFLNAQHQIPPMRFTKHFPCGGVATLRISVGSRPLPGADFYWTGPRSDFGEYVAWAQECFRFWSNLSGRRAVFLSISKAGVCELWESLPDRAPRCMAHIDQKKPPLELALNFVRQMLSHPQGIEKGGAR